MTKSEVDARRQQLGGVTVIELARLGHVMTKWASVFCKDPKGLKKKKPGKYKKIVGYLQRDDAEDELLELRAALAEKKPDPMPAMTPERTLFLLEKLRPHGNKDSCPCRECVKGRMKERALGLPAAEAG